MIELASFDETVVGMHTSVAPGAAANIAFDLRVEVVKTAVEQLEVVGRALHMKRMFTVIMGRARAANDDVFKRPVSSLDEKALHVRSRV